MQKKHNSNANALELHLVCIKPLFCNWSDVVIAVMYSVFH